MDESGLSLNRIKAVAVSSGPGSYTGLRVGMSAAKGLCFALNVPLISINTLQMMAAAAQTYGPDRLCPMIDARRMEVFTALYNRNLEEIKPAAALVLTPDSFREVYMEQPTLFFGNGAAKFRQFASHPNAVFTNLEINAQHMAVLSHNKYLDRNFTDLAYSEPFYGKAFHSTIR